MTDRIAVIPADARTVEVDIADHYTEAKPLPIPARVCIIEPEEE